MQEEKSTGSSKPHDSNEGQEQWSGREGRLLIREQCGYERAVQGLGDNDDWEQGTR